MTTDADQHSQIGKALRMTARLIKAASFYPPHHPALGTALQEAFDAYAPLLTEGNLNLTVKKTGFQLGEAPVAKADPVLQKLADFFFTRRLHRIFFMTDLSERDLMAFAQAMILDPESIQRRGGVPELLREARVTTLWANEIDLSRVRAEEEPAPDPWEQPRVEDWQRQITHGAEELWHRDPSAVRDLETVLWDLQQAPTDERYAALLQELIPKVWDYLNPDGRSLVIQAFFTLASNAGDPHLSPACVEESNKALESLGSEHHFQFLIETLCQKDLKRFNRAALENIFAYYKNRVLHLLMQRLTVEEDGQCRRYLTDVLRHQTPAAIPEMAPYLNDKRWYVVRNAALVLGEIRHPGALPPLVKLLGHRDLRVRRESLRAVTKIGGKQAEKILVRVVEMGDPELEKQALLSLGALKDPETVPFLLKLALRPDPLGKETEQKVEAIRALGKIGSTDATEGLLSLLNQVKFWGRGRYDTVRAAAASALGDIGDSRAVSALETASRKNSEEVSRAAFGALKLIKAGTRHESGNP